MMWYFKEDGDRLKLVSGSTTFTVLKLERDDAESTIRVYPIGDREPCLYNLDDFDAEKSAFGSKLKLATHSRGLFVKVYDVCREDGKMNGEYPVDQRKSSEKTKAVTKGQSPTSKDSQKMTQKTTSAKISVTTNEQTAAKKPTKTQYDNSLKIIGDCVEVHISNLIEPAASRLVRPVDPDHVRVLTEEFRRSSSQFVVLAGHVDDGIDTNILREPDCGVSVETLGGNHTRIALQYLNSANQLQNGMVKVCLYQGLSDDEALEVGFLHNKQAELSKKMSFMDQARLIKDKLQRCPADKMLSEKKKLAKIFDKANVTKLNHDYKAHLALATKATQEIWDLAINIEKSWREGKVKGGKKGQEVKQTIFKNLYSYNLQDGDRVQLLKLILTEGTAAYSKRLMTMVDKNDRKDNKDMEEAEIIESVDEPVTEGATAKTTVHVETTSTSDESDHELQDEMVRQLMEENDELKDENNKLKKENEELKRVVAELKARTENKASNVGTKPLPKKRCLSQTQVHSFCVGEAVNAVWSGNGKKYDATILKKHDNDMYTVKFYDKHVEKRSAAQIDPLPTLPNSLSSRPSKRRA